MVHTVHNPTLPLAGVRILSVEQYGAGPAGSNISGPISGRRRPPTRTRAPFEMASSTCDVTTASWPDDTRQPISVP